jgi:hypothetical protein
LSHREVGDEPELAQRPQAYWRRNPREGFFAAGNSLHLTFLDRGLADGT